MPGNESDGNGVCARVHSRPPWTSAARAEVGCVWTYRVEVGLVQAVDREQQDVLGAGRRGRSRGGQAGGGGGGGGGEEPGGGGGGDQP